MELVNKKDVYELVGLMLINDIISNEQVEEVQYMIKGLPTVTDNQAYTEGMVEGMKLLSLEIEEKIEKLNREVE